jgi:phosphatidate cytidylyltransferase
MDANLVRRVGFAVIAIPLALGVVYLGGLPLVGLLALAAGLGAGELFRLAERQGVRPARVLGIASAAVIPGLAYAAISPSGWGEGIANAWPYLGALWIMLLLTWALADRAPDERPLEAVGTTLLGVAYTGVLPAFILAIRHTRFPERSWAGAWLVFYPLIVTWVCDTAAMFGGRYFGGAKLAPNVSPGKTKSGTVAGVVGSLAVAPLFAFGVFPLVGVSIPVWQLLAMAAALSVVGQVGDLAESLFKREAGVKDSSHLIPGHGGVLDRLDSLYFVVPTAAALYRAFGAI